MKDYLMAIDAGTGSVRAIIFDLKGQQISVGQREWKHLPVPDVEGSMSFDLENNWMLTCECIAEAITTSGLPPTAIKGMSTCSMREGIILYDKNRQPIWGCANVDSRAGKQVADLKDQIIGQTQPFEEAMYQNTGQTLALSAVPRLLWLKQHNPEIYEATSTMTMISDWLSYQLSGELAVDPSNAGTTGILSLHHRDWYRDILEQSGIKSTILPPVKETGTQLGQVSEKAAKACGLQAGTPVVMGGGDVQLGCLGLGVVRASQTAVLGGTFWQQVVNLPQPMTDPAMDIRINPHVIPEMAQAESISFFTGLVMRWFRDAFCSEEKRLAESTGKDAYTLLEEQAMQVPAGSYGVLSIFSDAMHFKKWYHAAPSFINLSIEPEKCNKAVLFRALQENAAIVSLCNLEQIAQFSNTQPEYIVFAGGASKGTLWPQILADVTGKEIRIPVVKEATALGCAIAAGVGVGLYDDLASTGERLVQWDKIIQPNADVFEQYQTVRHRWETVYQKQLDLVDSGLTTTMWKAPGL